MASITPPAGAQPAPLQGLGSQQARARSDQGATAATTGAAGKPAGPQDIVETWRGAADAVRFGVSQLDFSAAAARSAAPLFEALADALDTGDVASAETARSALRATLDGAIEAGAGLLSGAALRLDLGDGGVFQVDGVDLRALSGDAATARAGAAAADEAAARWDGLASRLHQHQAILATAAGQAEGARADLDSQSALLAALQVRQALVDAGGASIAMGDPKAILSLFKS